MFYAKEACSEGGCRRRACGTGACGENIYRYFSFLLQPGTGEKFLPEKLEAAVFSIRGISEGGIFEAVFFDLEKSGRTNQPVGGKAEQIECIFVLGVEA